MHLTNKLTIHMLRTPEFQWSLSMHRFAPTYLRKTIVTLTMIRSLEHWFLPNELLFLIFEFL